MSVATSSVLPPPTPTSTFFVIVLMMLGIRVTDQLAAICCFIALTKLCWRTTR